MCGIIAPERCEIARAEILSRDHVGNSVNA
jgi:hypothetical protein